MSRLGLLLRAIDNESGDDDAGYAVQFKPCKSDAGPRRLPRAAVRPAAPSFLPQLRLLEPRRCLRARTSPSHTPLHQQALPVRARNVVTLEHNLFAMPEKTVTF